MRGLNTLAANFYLILLSATASRPTPSTTTTKQTKTKRRLKTSKIKDKIERQNKRQNRGHRMIKRVVTITTGINLVFLRSKQSKQLTLKRGTCLSSCHTCTSSMCPEFPFYKLFHAQNNTKMLSRQYVDFP